MFKEVEKNYDKEQGSRELERKYKLFYEYALLPYQSLDENTKIIDINQAWLDFFGYAKEEVLGKCFGEFLVNKSRELLTSRFSHFKRVGVIQDVEYEIVKKNGIHRIIWLDGRIEYDENEDFKQAHCFFKDITERKRTEEKLKESESKYRYFFDNAQIGLYWSRISDGKFLECNEVFAKLFGYKTREELLEEYIATEHYVYPNQRNEILDAIRIKKEVRGYEILVTKRDGTPIWLSVSARMSEKENRIEGAAIDITKRKKAEQELLESEERYRKAYDKADFYKDLLAHDVSNIFNNINASVQLLKIWKEDYNVSEKEVNMIGIIKQQLERGASLVSNVRKLSEIEEGEMSVYPFDVKEVLEKCVDEISSRFHERGIEINFKANQEITNVMGGELLIDAFENLLINGVIHNDSDKARLWVNLFKIYQEDKKFIKIEFKDNGLGIIDDRKKTIFKRNYQKDRSTGGMGIGLSLVKTIINNYGGQVWVENRARGDYSQGSNFIILLKEG